MVTIPLGSHNDLSTQMQFGSIVTVGIGGVVGKIIGGDVVEGVVEVVEEVVGGIVGGGIVTFRG